MKERHLIFGSMTEAQKAKNFLQSKGISAAVLKTPEKNSRGGCTYSVRTSNADAAQSLLKKIGILAKGKY